MLRFVSCSRLTVLGRQSRGRKQQSRKFSDVSSSSTYSSGSPVRRMRPTTSQSSAVPPSAPTEKTFVSAHYKVDEEQVERFLARRNIVFHPAGNELKLQCPFCPPDRNRSGFRLTISKENGNYHCSVCQARGSWFVLFSYLVTFCRAAL